MNGKSTENHWWIEGEKEGEREGKAFQESLTASSLDNRAFSSTTNQEEVLSSVLHVFR